MGLFKKLFGGVTEDFKKSMGESLAEVSQSIKEVFEESASTSAGDAGGADDSDVKIPIGELKDGVLTIREGITKLDEESLEGYKNLRKIVFPESLEELDEYVISKQKQLEELDFSRVTKLKVIPDNFIEGETRLKEVVFPQGVESIGDEILGSSKTIKEVYIPSSVCKIGYLSNGGRNSIDAYLFSPSISDIEDFSETVNTLYVLPESFNEYADMLKEAESDAHIRVMPDDKINFYDTISARQVPSPSKASAKNSITSKNNTIGKEEEEIAGKLWWVKDLVLLYNGSKYALKYGSGKDTKVTGYVYDDVELLNEYQARLTQKQPDGTLRYGVASTCGWKFIVANCEYTKITFLDGIGAILAVDEDGDEYAIDRWGQTYSLEAYTEKAQEN
ncbi:MAG: leucine-rich repeat protein [Prevotella sp.]|nr:leucine-rich repeat protein [Prevotella sp.]